MTAPFEITESIKQRFFAKVQKSDHPDGCWLWTACCRNGGYGCMKVGEKLADAHRLSWLIHNGEIPDSKMVLHRCDVRQCVNPTHLFIGTHLDNMHDAQVKGRLTQAGVKGCVNSSNKLTFEQAEEIRKRYATGKVTLAQLADEYKVGSETIRRVVIGETLTTNKQYRHPARTEPLTAEQIAQLQHDYEHGVSKRQLAQKYNVAPSSLDRLLSKVLT